MQPEIGYHIAAPLRKLPDMQQDRKRITLLNAHGHADVSEHPASHLAAVQASNAAVRVCGV